MHKVAAIERSMRPFTGACLRVVACPWDVREADDMTPADLTVVAVDSPIARRVIHSSGTIFLDLRTMADGFIALDSSVDRDFVTRMTPDQPSRKNSAKSRKSRKNKGCLFFLLFLLFASS